MCADLSVYHSFYTGAFWGGKFSGIDWSADGQCVYRNLSDAAAVWIFGKSYQRGALTGIFVCDSGCDVYYA